MIRLLLLLFCIFQLGFSQTEKRILGTVLSDGIPLQNVDVINLETKQIVVTDVKGNFSILTKLNETLIFVVKNHQITSVKINEFRFYKTELEVVLTKEIEVLNEVVVKNKSVFSKQIMKTIINQNIKTTGVATTRNPFINDGTIPNGIDFIRLGKEFFSLFKNKDATPKKVIPKIEFKKYLKKSLDENYFIKTLQLKPEEVALFLEFCEADPKSKTISESNSVLDLMDFLLVKKNEFRKF